MQKSSQNFETKVFGNDGRYQPATRHIEGDILKTGQTISW